MSPDVSIPSFERGRDRGQLVLLKWGKGEGRGTPRKGLASLLREA